MDALMTGAAKPSAAQKGRSIDLDGAIRAKMEHAFGDLSAVKLYESRAVGDAGAEAIAQGNEIAFAPGMAKFSTRSGQERLGHELSHVMSQRSGRVRGQGFLASAALEAQADREGAMAAAGEQVYTGPVTHALSDASPSPAVAGPMQATREDEPDRQLAPAQDIQSPNLAQPRAARVPVMQPARDIQPPNVAIPAPAPRANRVPVMQPARDIQPPTVVIPPVAQRPKASSKGRGADRPQNLIHGDDELINLLDPEPRSPYAADFDLLNSQQGSKEERKNAYNHLVIPTAEGMTEDQQQAVSEYIRGSSGHNTYLRGQKDNLYYPQTEQEIQRTRKQTEDISQMIQSNPLPEQLTTYRGTTDKFFASLLQQNGLGKAVKDDSSVDHEWLNKNQKKLRKNLVGKTFHEKAFTSASTEKAFAQEWSRQSSLNEKNFEYGMTGQIQKALALQGIYQNHPEQLPGAHLMTMNLPKGAKGAFIDRATDKLKRNNNQREVLLDKGSMFKISDVRKMEASDSYELVMDLLTEEAGKKKKKK